MKNSKLFAFFLVFTVAFFTSNICKAQFCGCDYESDNFRSFLYTKMLVVLDGTPQYNEALKQAIKDHWKITNYQFIESSQVNLWIDNERYSFMMPVIIEEIRNNDIATYTKQFNYLAVFLGGKKSVKKYSKNDLIAYAPFDFDNLEKEKSESAFRMGFMVRSMHDAIQIMQQEKFTGNFEKLEKSLIEHYNKKTSTLAKKTLLIDPDYFTKKFGKIDFAHAYPYKYEIADRKKISQLMKDKDFHYLYLSIVSTDEKYLFVYNLYSGEVIYACFKVVGDVFNKKEIKNMANAAG
jgi:hypothetical protein